ncbi:MaoC family dehydratase [Clostridium sp. LP20]|uniref:MaoC family dehydratase n=1 Tax=Clostridium sp. LP20 TaxID=3418665 RepID=UPI003EE61067
MYDKEDINEYRFSEISIGMKEKFNVIITKEKMEQFRKITGDNNPMHTDEDFATNRGFDNVLVYGMLTASFFSTLVGMYLPGKYCLFQSVDNIYFHRPVYIGDNLTVQGTVIEIDDRFFRIGIKGEIFNSQRKKVCTGILYLKVMEE